MVSLPTVTTVCGLSAKSIILILSPLAAALSLVNAAWDWYNLAEWSEGLSNFKKVFEGLQAFFLTVLFIVTIIGFFGVWKRSIKVTAIYSHVCWGHFMVLFLLGLIHIISIARDHSRFYDACHNNGFKLNISHTDADCQHYYHIRIAIAVALWIAEEVVLLALSICLRSYKTQLIDTKRGGTESGYGANTAQYYTGGQQQQQNGGYY